MLLMNENVLKKKEEEEEELQTLTWSAELRSRSKMFKTKSFPTKFFFKSHPVIKIENIAYWLILRTTFGSYYILQGAGQVLAFFDDFW